MRAYLGRSCVPTFFLGNQICLPKLYIWESSNVLRCPLRRFVSIIPPTGGDQSQINFASSPTAWPLGFLTGMTMFARSIPYAGRG
ncbi:uncharacterized protein K489DRAFT_191034 [Dissoconium aciculare CBS 342.82]|uniref:Uncharacterized protein n=1 Tax=Dissoconium aciculare CBS 342.82 TaxID=1314786 RepID=A0A6J3M6W4_9PEZI|nr:uncharacterized protein K489DRAFT_191034 [Dissoconium aciculare CBS 342.82]KAF1823259.1 hypothetical protein K489DRAFT_191034 [Dissoconium aciculare CBS 342.82]